MVFVFCLTKSFEDFSEYGKMTLHEKKNFRYGHEVSQSMQKCSNALLISFILKLFVVIMALIVILNLI